MDNSFDYLHLIYLLGVLILVAPGGLYILRNKSRALRQVVLWLSIIVVLALFYRAFGWPPS